MQPIFFSFVSGLHYRKTVKLYFSRISAFDLVVSICENMLFQCFSSFLTAGNKSYCGTFQRLTHPRQSTVEPILRPASSQNRQASQRKTFALSSASTQTSSHLRKHRTSVPSRPQKLPGALIRTPGDPQPHTRCAPNAPPSMPQALPPSRPRCVPPFAPTLPPHPSRTPDVHLPPQIRMQFPNRSDSVIQRDTNKQGIQRELHAKLQHLWPLAGPVATPHGGHRAQAATHPDK